MQRVALLLIVLGGCEKEAPAFGTIQGHVTLSVLGGAPDEHGMGVYTTTPMRCTVRFMAANGKQIGDAATDANGAFVLKVPAGRYQVSFETCGGIECEQAGPIPRTVDVTVTKDASVDASWGCSYNAG